MEICSAEADIKKKKLRLKSLYKGAQYKFAEEIGVLPKELSKIMNNQKWNMPNSVRNALWATGHSVEWIELGIGGPYLKGSEKLPSQSTSGQLPEHMFNNVTFEDHVSATYYEDINVSAGLGSEVDDEGSKKQLFLPVFLFKGEMLTQKENIICANVSGDSMQCFGNPLSIEPEDLIFIVPQEDSSVIEGKIYAISFQNQVFVKQVQMIYGEDPKLRMISLNEKYEIQEIKGDFLKETRIVGRVIGKLRRF